jgi:hypothetical protein
LNVIFINGWSFLQLNRPSTLLRVNFVAMTLSFPGV